MLLKTLFALILLSISLPASAWYDCYWPFRTEIQVAEAAGVTVTGYQAKLALDSSTFHASYSWSSAGADIRLVDADDLTPLEFFIESWDAVGKKAVISVKLDLAAGSNNKIYLYYGNTDSPSASNALQTFTEVGTRFHTRYSTNDPQNKAAGFSLFDGLGDTTAGYGCSVVSNFSRINNRSQNSPPSISSNYGALAEAFFKVSSGESGLWSFRYGGDFGRGGGLYIDGVTLEESWTDDMWWGFRWTNPAETLEGTINLTEGYHKMEAIGFEGCCDGPSDIEFKKPGGSYQTFSTSVLDNRSRQCPTIPPNVNWNNLQFEPPVITIGKSSTVLSDPISGTNSPKRIPGAVIRYKLVVKNAGTAVGRNSISINDPLPSRVEALVGAANIGFEDGLPSSQLSFIYDSTDHDNDDASFSNDAGSTYDYTPVADAIGADSSVSHINFKPQGRFGCSNTATPASFSIYYDVVIK